MVKDFSVFDFSYIPERPFMREEARVIIDAILRYAQTGIAKNLALFGSRDCGKTLLVRYLTKELHDSHGLTMLYCNVRNHNTSFKILAYLLDLRVRGASFDELVASFRERYPAKVVVVLDEIDFMSSKDRYMEILYRLSRSSNNYMLILLSNNPKLIRAMDPSTRSTLQPDALHFRDYDASEIREILESRATQGLKSYREEDLGKIAALTTRDTNSDVRVAIKTLFYAATESETSIEKAFERAGRDIVVDVVEDLNERCLTILEGIRRAKSDFAKNAFKRYQELSSALGETPFSYAHFLNNLGYLQSCGLLILVSTKVERCYTYRIHLLPNPDIIAETFSRRFLQ